jgi:hypothetical protein
MKTIKSSNGQAQVRYVISTTLAWAIGSGRWSSPCLPQVHALSPAARFQSPDRRPVGGQSRHKYVQDKPVFPALLHRCCMKIAVLSRNPRLYSTRRLVEAGPSAAMKWW